MQSTRNVVGTVLRRAVIIDDNEQIRMIALFSIASGAANTHRRDRCGYLHITGMRNLAGNESKSSINETEQRIIAVGGGIKRIFAERHARVGNEIQRTPVWKSNSDRRAWTGLDTSLL